MCENRKGDGGKMVDRKGWRGKERARVPEKDDSFSTSPLSVSSIPACWNIYSINLGGTNLGGERRRRKEGRKEGRKGVHSRRLRRDRDTLEAKPVITRLPGATAADCYLVSTPTTLSPAILLPWTYWRHARTPTRRTLVHPCARGETTKNDRGFLTPFFSTTIVFSIVELKNLSPYIYRNHPRNRLRRSRRDTRPRDSDYVNRIPHDNSRPCVAIITRGNEKNESD